MPTLEATRTVRYAGKDQQPGDQFEASDKDAKILIAIKKAKVPEGPVKTASDLPSEIMSRSSRREPLTEVVEDEAPKSQAYHRRDMVAKTPKAPAPKKRGRPGKTKKS